MVYITTKASPRYHQISIEEYLFGTDDIPEDPGWDSTGTVTRKRETLSGVYLGENRLVEIANLTNSLRQFNEATAEIRKAPRNSLYREFYIPKKSGGLRKIDAPVDDLKDCLRKLQKILEGVPTQGYHTSAFAYIEGRCPRDAMVKHQQNRSMWFAKFDLHDFFGSTTPEFLTKMLSMVYPYSVVLDSSYGNALTTALDLCFKDGGLPQGTPISPYLTNLMMIPIDYELSNWCRERRMVYTRYADDFQISSRNCFPFREVEEHIREVLREFGAPFQINSSKTRYGSRAGSNWNLGMMLNKDNEITIGRQKKKQFENMLFSYAKDRTNGIRWEEHDIRVLDGLRSHYKSIEGEVIDRIVSHVGSKVGVDIPAAICEDLSN